MKTELDFFTKITFNGKLKWKTDKMLDASIYKQLKKSK